MTKLYKLVCIAALALATASCSGYHIYGTVDNPDLEGAKIYMVPMVEDFNVSMLDSTYIKDLKFEFSGKEERAVDLRIEKSRRDGIQNLFIITEPGRTHVVIGEDSRSWGTPQNDTIQVYKDLVILHSMECRRLYFEGKFNECDSVHLAIMGRIKQLMCNASGTTLGAFLEMTNPDMAAQIKAEQEQQEE